ncbi:MAG: hypothetical protein SFV54_23130 [Bryobacteraceae bacterium]|nr:hypothetical protein [Bryobacteraceae bacterium]
MLLLKFWLETRVRLAICVFLPASLAFAAWQVGVAARSGKSLDAAMLGATPWEHLLVSMAALAVPMIALILAGTGLMGQTSSGMTQGIHPSTYYTLTLPVTRTRLLFTRTVFGLGLTAAVIALIVVLLLLLREPLRAPHAPASVLLLYPYMLTGAAVYYSFATLIYSWFDEFWGGMITLFVTGGFIGYSIGGGSSWASIPSFMRARTALEAGDPALLQAAFYLVLSAAFLGGALWILKRKEF